MVLLRQKLRSRFIISILFTVVFIITAAFTFYYLKTDKDNEYISLLLTLALLSFGLTLGNIIVLLSLVWLAKRY